MRARTTIGVPFSVLGLQPLFVRHVLEHERVVDRDVRIAFHRELGNALPGRAEPALPDHSSIVSPGCGSRISTPEASSRSFAGVPVRSGNVP